MQPKQILQHKTYLYLTEFFSGMAVMAVELGASRLLAPYFSSSQIVWTIIIGTIMIAMALGNLWGGRSADKDPNPDRLYKRIVIAALWIAAIPLVGKYIIIAISGALIIAVDTSFLTIATFLSCAILFVYPLVLLGTVTPCLAKYCTNNLESNGQVVGNLVAFNTIGSILGTFLPTFLTIPTVGTAITFLIFSGVLLLLGLIYFWQTRQQQKCSMAVMIIFILCSVYGHHDSFAFWKQNLLYEGESIYNYLQVEDTPSSIILSTNVLFGIQSIKEKHGGLTNMYYDYALAAPALTNDSAKTGQILILGMGTGTFASQCQHYFPDFSIEGVEIDRKITTLAHDYFSLSPTIPVATYDGRAYLTATNKKYDVIMVDAYQDITIPFYMSSIEFFQLVKNHLSDEGIMVVNMNIHSDGNNGINAYLADTIAAVFPHVATIDVPGATNRELFASTRTIKKNALQEQAQKTTHNDLTQLLHQANNRWTPYERGSLILTDDKAPVETLGMHTLDEIIQKEAGSSRDELQILARNILQKN